MKGYHRNDAATQGCIDKDGFLHTGDVCYADSDGCYYVVDRLKGSMCCSRLQWNFSPHHPTITVSLRTV